MWFNEKRKQPLPDEDEYTAGTHQTPEARLARNETYATFEDLDGLPDEALYEIAQECSEDALPDECVPCRAFAMILERNADLSEHVATTLSAAIEQPLDEEILSGSIRSSPDGPTLEEFVDERSVAERFADKVRELDDYVQQMLLGPPIPPPNVTLEELAALVVGAQKWSHMIDAQGLELAPNQQAVKEEIDRVVAKVRSS